MADSETDLLVSGFTCLFWCFIDLDVQQSRANVGCVSLCVKCCCPCSQYFHWAYTSTPETRVKHTHISVSLCLSVCCFQTTLARIIASSVKKQGTGRFVPLSATSASTSDVREVIKQAQNELRLFKRKTILFIDEIHRFNKSQQVSYSAVDSYQIGLSSSQISSIPFECFWIPFFPF